MPAHPAGLAGAVYRCAVTHHGLEGTRCSFSYRISLVLTDIDAVPRAVPGYRLRRVCAADHLGDPAGSLRENVAAFLRHSGVDLDGGAVLMLSQCRGLGYVFDPITLFWCNDRAGHLSCVIAEVRNTLGDRHCYLLYPGKSGRTAAAKQMYVSPFLPVDGRYVFLIGLTESQVRLSATVRRGGPDGAERPALTATLTGTRGHPGAARRMGMTLPNPVTVRLTPPRTPHPTSHLPRRRLPLRPRLPPPPP